MKGFRAEYSPQEADSARNDLSPDLHCSIFCYTRPFGRLKNYADLRPTMYISKGWTHEQADLAVMQIIARAIYPYYNICHSCESMGPVRVTLDPFLLYLMYVRAHAPVCVRCCVACNAFFPPQTLRISAGDFRMSVAKTIVR